MSRRTRERNDTVRTTRRERGRRTGPGRTRAEHGADRGPEVDDGLSEAWWTEAKLCPRCQRRRRTGKPLEVVE